MLRRSFPQANVQLVESGTQAMDRKEDRRESAPPGRRAVLLFLAVLTLGVRLPFFFPAVIDWDESAFILVGQAVLDGDLPYVHVWENKPPVAFLFFSASIALFGKTIVAVRVAGAICVLIISWLTYEIGVVLSGPRAAFWAALLCVCMMSLLPSAQATMCEHVALVPMMAAILLLVRRPWGIRELAIAGSLLAAAAMIRLNLALVPVALVPLLVVGSRSERMRDTFGRLSAFALSGASVVGLTVLPYLIQGKGRVWWNSVVLAPLEYATAQLSMASVSMRHLEFIERSIAGEMGALAGISALCWVGGMVGWLLIVLRRRFIPHESRHCVPVLGVAFVATAISIARGGAAYAHYLLQLVPFMTLGSGVLLALIEKRARRGVVFIALLCLGASLRRVASE